MAISQDSSTPSAPAELPDVTTGTSVTASFSPPAGSLVVAQVGIGYFATSTAPAVTLADSLGNTYTAKASKYDGLFDYAGIFSFYYATAPGSITLTVTRSIVAAAEAHLAEEINRRREAEAERDQARADREQADDAAAQAITRMDDLPHELTTLQDS